MRIRATAKKYILDQRSLSPRGHEKQTWLQHSKTSRRSVLLLSVIRAGRRYVGQMLHRPQAKPSSPLRFG